MENENDQLPVGNDDQNEQNDNQEVPNDSGEGAIIDDQGEGGQSNQTPIDPQQVDPLQFIDSLENVDPKVKEVLKAGYLRQADYTKKTQALGEDRKLLDEYKEIKPYLDKAIANPETYKQIFGVEPGEEKPEYPEDPKEYAEWVKNNTLQAIEQEFDFKQAETLDPRLNEDEDFAYAVAGLVAMDQDFRAGKKSAVQVTTESIKKLDSFLAKQKEVWRKEMTNKARERRMVVPNQGTPVGTGGNKVPATMQEAAQMAEEQMK